jgi:S-(hydroxymethyl)glutathione dehydrogenase/alcohol dehydrogenase
VILGWIKGRGMDAGGTSYSRDGRVINSGGVTTFNEFSIVAENRCVLLPPGVPSDIAVLFGCAIPTGAGMVINSVKPEPGSTLAFFGIGGVGLSALMAAGLFDCRAVIAVDLERSKLDLAADFGATHTIDSSKCDPVQEIMKITDGRGVDFAVEAAGVVDTIQQAFESIRFNGGLCIFATHPKHGDKISIDPFDLIRGKRIIGSWGGESNPDEDVPKIAGLYTSGKLPLEKFLEQRYSLDEINQALDDLENRKTVRALIEIDPELF